MQNPNLELLIGFFAINRALNEEMRGVRRLLKQRNAEAKHNPNWRLQPRAPKGTAEGGRWTDGGGGGAPKQQPVRAPRPVQRPSAPPSERPRRETRPRPVPRAPEPRPSGRIERPAARESTQSVPLTVFRLSPITTAVFLSGDTPRAIVTTRSVPGTTDLLLVEVDDRQAGQRFASFQRVVAPAQQVPLVVFGVDTGLLTTKPAELENLYVNTVIDGDDVQYNPRELALAYGREIPGIATLEGGATSGPPELVPSTQEERRLAHNLRQLGFSNFEIGVALQQLRNEGGEGSEYVRALRARGATRGQIRAALRELQRARRDRPYSPPSSGPLLEIFPGLATAPGSTRVFSVESGLNDIAPEILASEMHSRELADTFISEIRAIDSSYEPPTFNDPANFPRSAAGRSAYLDGLRQERAAILYRVRGETTSLQIEMLRFTQQRVDVAYQEALAKLAAGDLDIRFGPNQAVGDHIDTTVRQELRDFLDALGIPEDDLVRVNRREYITRRTFRRPDARVADMAIDFSLAEKAPGDRQIVGYFNAISRPTYVVIVRPSPIGGTYIITPPPGRYARK